MQFDSYNESSVNGNMFTVEIIVRSCEKYGRKIIRFQFSLKLAYAITIYRLQDLTIRVAKMEIVDREFAIDICFIE